MYFRTGWIRDEAAVEAVRGTFADEGRPCGAYESRPDLEGYWSREVARGVTGVFLSESERTVHGEFLKGPFQRRGTCVGQGFFQMLQKTLCHSIHVRRFVSRPVLIAYEPIYGLARVEIGGRRIRGDGAVVAHAARAVDRFGLVERGVYGQYDLSDPREDLAVAWGDAGVPDEVQNAGAGHECRVMEARNGLQMADLIAAGYAGSHGSQVYGSSRGSRDGRGMMKIGRRQGGHNECVSGVFLTREVKDPNDLDELRASTGFVRDGSWGQWPGGPTVLRYAGGEWTMPANSYGVTLAECEAGLRSGGECWHAQIDHGNGWKPEGILG